MDLRLAGMAAAEFCPSERDVARWYAVHTYPRHEKRVAEHLRLRSIETFLPLHRATHRWKNGLRAEVELPLFPGYLFTRLAHHEWSPVLQAPSVVTLVGARGQPEGIPESEIETVRRAVQAFKADRIPFWRWATGCASLRAPWMGSRVFWYAESRIFAWCSQSTS